MENTTELQARVKSLEERLAIAEEQLALCLRYMARAANKELDSRLDKIAASKPVAEA